MESSTKTSTRTKLPILDAIIIGGVSQGVAGWMTNPVDVLKTRVQANLSNGMRDALSSVMKESGAVGLMKGAGMRTLWIAPQGCVYYPVYELMQSFQF
jgi:hypothetical protein